MKDIVIIANFNRFYSVDDYGRFMHIAHILAETNRVEIVTSDFDHITKKKKAKAGTINNIIITELPEIGYRKNVSFQRFGSHYLWGRQVRKYLHGRKKPDIVYCAIPSLTAARYAAEFCKKENIQFCIDIQDLWPEAFKVAFNIPVVSSIVFSPFSKMADYSYKLADMAFAVSETYINRVKRVNHRARFNVVYLGNRLEDFDLYAKQNRVDKSNEEFWIGYCGTLGASYDISVILEALSLLKNNNIVFHVMGNGPKLEEFKSKAKSLGVNAVFHGRLEYPLMCGLISSCDVAVNPIMHGAAQSIINKHSDYAAAGIPVINTQECIEYRNMVDKYKMGFNCENGNAVEVSQKIIKLLEDKEMRIQMGKNSRRCAEENFDRNKSYKCLTQWIVGE